MRLYDNQEVSAGIVMEQVHIEVIDRAYAAVLAAKTPAERASMISDCQRTARHILRAGEMLRHPDWSEEQVARVVARRIAGSVANGAD